ncbi:MAG: ATP-binding protein, partial [Bacteroidales bacterium]|nr:ATP-binding protein [Bacteroidales bacterium]
FLFFFFLLKYSIVVQSILFTMAILENIRIKNKNVDLSIQNHLQFIEYQKWEMEMVNSELEKLSIVASETENAVAICDISGKIDWCNNAYEKLYDIDFGQLIKDGRRSLFTIHDNEAIKHNFHKCIEYEKAQVFEMNINTVHRKKIWVQSTLTPYIKDDVLTKIITIDTDISDLKKYQVKLEHAKDKAIESDKLKTAFLGNISHEIRTPLNGIIGFSELLELHAEKNDKVQQYINTIRGSGEQLLVIIDDLLDISLIETNQLKLKLMPCKLEEILLEVIQNYYGIRKSLNKDHIALFFNKNISTNGIIQTDPARVRQVFSNLLSNAFKFTDAGSVSVNLDESDNYYTISVTDTGIGLPADKNDFLFKSFRQNESTLNRKFGGTGVGLAICKGIIDKLKGKIWIDSNYANGARFCFSLKK